jgi:hypothetical protein
MGLQRFFGFLAFLSAAFFFSNSSILRSSSIARPASLLPFRRSFAAFVTAGEGFFCFGFGMRLPRAAKMIDRNDPALFHCNAKQASKQFAMPTRVQGFNDCPLGHLQGDDSRTYMIFLRWTFETCKPASPLGRKNRPYTVFFGHITSAMERGNQTTSILL